MRIPFAGLFKRNKTETPALQKRALTYQPPLKVFIERYNEQEHEWSGTAPPGLQRLVGLLDGFYGSQNYVTLFHCLPEVFAPIHEIASRVADANWLLKKTWNDEVDFNDETFNRLFSKPNPLQFHRGLVYMSVVYEILCGKHFWYLNKPTTLVNPVFKDIATWTNLVAHEVNIVQKKTDPYTALDIKDFIDRYEVPLHDYVRKFPVNNVIPILNLSLEKGYNDLNRCEPLIKGADKAIRNLIPVYEARGVIYIKRGALGFIVSRKEDESGGVPLTPAERKQLDKDFTQTYGITNGKETMAMTGMPVDFVRTAMSIQELQPFDETLADAAAIYATLRVPRHLIPSKDNSTFANADADLKAFYENVIIPWAKRYAQAWDGGLGLAAERRYISPDFDHVGVLQKNMKDESAVDKAYGEIWLLRFMNGVCSLNEWIMAIEGTKGSGPIFDKKISEMTPEEIELVKKFINLKTKTDDKNTSPEDKGLEGKGGTD